MLAGAMALVASLGLVAEALAQAPPTRLRSSIVAIDGKTATIATREGTSVPVKLADNWTVMLVSPMTLDDIKENSFVGIASLDPHWNLRRPRREGAACTASSGESRHHATR
jgi:hypothetical protein